MDATLVDEDEFKQDSTRIGYRASTPSPTSMPPLFQPHSTGKVPARHSSLSGYKVGRGRGHDSGARYPTVSGTNSDCSCEEHFYFGLNFNSVSIAQGLFQRKGKKGDKKKKGGPFTLHHCCSELENEEKWKNRDLYEIPNKRKAVEVDEDDENDGSGEDNVAKPKTKSGREIDAAEHHSYK
ncbi:hypothetical protein ZWY2020_029359 [Hordeum vulgare]|nr:hypothetical protein ZWY2020_029359 [Hordeum vulgare]